MMTMIHMNTSGETREATDDYSDEVLDAGWLPRPDTGPETILHESELARARSAKETRHAEHFLETFYRCQE